ncbi:hypothetical protein RJ639_009278 [Escallonia herrerae]|uniref:Uncharacterized protein n=1 Tax=Escallonia herrerae TaxID=1293975 RepID=A0AA88VR86_9ASTE|nr:hypothetical protein RJ639_009278 [Escallonia herrerae]
MGLFTYTLAGGGFILIGAWEFLLSSSQTLKTPQPSPSQSPPSHSTITFVAIFLLSFFFILNSLISLTSAVSSKDQSGIVLQLQMGFSFYSDSIVHGCYLSEKSRGNFTVKCKGHPEYHRGRAIATLQFNCHLALLVALLAGVYSIVSKKHGVSRGELTRYRPIGAEMQQLDGQAQFTLDSDDDDESGIVEEKNVVRQKALPVVPELGVNGFGSYH